MRNLFVPIFTIRCVTHSGYAEGRVESWWDYSGFICGLILLALIVGILVWAAMEEPEDLTEL